MKRIKCWFILKLFFPLADKLMGTCVMKWYHRIKEMNGWSAEAIEQWQNEQLQAFIAHAYHHTVYYRRIMDERGIKVEDIRCLDDLKRFPIMTKTIANAHAHEIVPDNLSDIKYRKARTGGTTGEPMHYNCDEEVWGYITAARMVAWESMGYYYGEKYIVFGRNSIVSKSNRFSIKSMYNKMRGVITFDAVRMNDERYNQIIDCFVNRHIEYMYGYPSSIYLLCKYILENQIQVKDKIKVVFTTSESLLPNYRQTIEDALGCKIMDCYGARDAGLSAYEVKRDNYFIGYNALCELIDLYSEHSGTLVSTNFFNYSFPLIRYEFGDEVVLTKEISIYNGQLFKQILGRTYNVMRLDNGNCLTAPAISSIFMSFDIVAFEIHQINGSEVDLIIQPKKDLFTASQEKQMYDIMNDYIGDGATLNIKLVEELKELPNGKRNYFYTN